jgi:hypothetical protein
MPTKDDKFLIDKQKALQRLANARKRYKQIAKSKNASIQFDSTVDATLDGSESKYEIFSKIVFDAIYMYHKNLEILVDDAFREIEKFPTQVEKTKAIDFFFSLVNFVDVVSKNFEKIAIGSGKNRYNNSKKAKEPFGKIAFPDSREDVDEYEENTQIETEIENALIDHFVDNVSITKQQSSVIKNILKRGLYSDIISSPLVQFAYRGMIVKEDWIKKVLGVSKEDIEHSLKNKGKFNAIEKNFVFKPKHGDSTSWTESSTIAYKFSQDSNNASIDRVKQFSIILHANTQENENSMLSCVGTLYNMSSAKEFSFEQEIIGLGPIKVQKVSWAAWAS